MNLIPPWSDRGGIVPVADDDFEEALREAHAADGKPADKRITLEEWEREFVKSRLTNGEDNGKMNIGCDDHNGKVFIYSSGQEISEKLYDLIIGDYVSKGFSEYDAQIKALERLRQNYDIYFREV